ncbi:MAG: endonuclease domain-containing protein [Candidatus Doudnabacteria bacterium]|nr:endonuclease domain-containing protein [Candidatus Doudnabacteria bacterium]
MKYLYNSQKLKLRRKLLRHNAPDPEQILWYYLRNKAFGYKFRRQYSVSQYVLDFYCSKLRLAIEIDGDSHFNPKARIYDTIREKRVKQQNIQILRFTNDEIRENIEAVIEKISNNLPPLTPPTLGGE